MTIETKYKIGDGVWFMKENKPIMQVVSFIEIIVASTTSECFIRYGFKTGGIIAERVVENHLFSTKEELLKSL